MTSWQINEMFFCS